MKPYLLITTALFSLAHTSCDGQSKSPTDATSAPQTQKAAIHAFTVELNATRKLFEFNTKRDVRLTATFETIDKDFNAAITPSTADIQYAQAACAPIWKAYHDRTLGIIAASEGKVPQNILDSRKKLETAKNEAYEGSIAFLESVLAFREALKHPIMGADKLAKTEIAVKANSMKLSSLRATEQTAETQFAELALPLLELTKETGEELLAAIERRTEELKTGEAQKPPGAK